MLFAKTDLIEKSEVIKYEIIIEDEEPSCEEKVHNMMQIIEAFTTEMSSYDYLELYEASLRKCWL